MTAYRVEVLRLAEKALKPLPKPIQRAIIAAIQRLGDNPRPTDARMLEGYPGFWRIREGNYRIIYTIKDRELLVMVIRIGDRKEIYRKLDRL